MDKVIDLRAHFTLRRMEVEKRRSLARAEAILANRLPYDLAVLEIDEALNNLDGIEDRLRRFGHELGLDLPNLQKVI